MKRTKVDPTMEVLLTCPGSDYPDVMFTVTDKSVVSDALRVAADEWNAVEELLQLSHEAELLRNSSLLVSYGLESGSQLSVSVISVFGKNWLVDDGKKKKLVELHERGDERLLLDTSTFAVDGCVEIKRELLPFEFSRISFLNPTTVILSADCSVSIIGNGFLKNSLSLTDIDFSGLQSVTSIGDCFLQECESLTLIGTSGLSGVRTINKGFLEGCLSLTSVDLSVFVNVESIGGGFLFECQSLLSVDLGALTHVIVLPDMFLARCKSLTSVSGLSSLVNKTEIGSCVFFTCLSLSSFDFSFFNNVTKIGTHFFGNCESLQYVDLSAFTKTTEIQNGFFSGCSRLTEIDISPLVCVSQVLGAFGNCSFFSGCGQLKLRGIDSFCDGHVVKQALF